MIIHLFIHPFFYLSIHLPAQLFTYSLSDLNEDLRTPSPKSPMASTLRRKTSALKRSPERCPERDSRSGERMHRIMNFFINHHHQ